MILVELEADLSYEMSTLLEALSLEDKLEAAQIMTEILAAFVVEAREQLRGSVNEAPLQ